MKGKKHNPEQIIKKLREADAMIATGKTIGQVVQSLEISEQTFHRWRNQYGGMKAEEAKRLKELEEENRRLKKLLAEAEVDKAITELTKLLQRSPSVGEIAELLEVEQTDVLEVLEANHNRRPLSLDRPLGGDESDEAPPSEWVGEEDARFELVEGRIALEEALPYLEERERVVLRLRFVDDLTQSQIAEKIGHSQMHVSRILRRALAHIRERIEQQQS